MVKVHKERVIINKAFVNNKSGFRKVLLSTSVSYEVYEMIEMIAALYRWSHSETLQYLTETDRDRII